MLKSLLAAYLESWRMLTGKRKQFAMVLLPISLLKVMAPLIIPFMLRMIFDAMESGNGSQVLASVLQSSIAFVSLLLIVFFVNIYGDAWASKISFYGIRNSYSRLFNLPVSQLTSRYSKGEVYNRIQAGCRSSLQLWFQSVDLLSNLVAVLGLLFLASLISPYVLGVVSVLAVTDLIVTFYLTKRNRVFAQRIQEEEDRRLETLHSVVHDSQFLKMNQSEPLLAELYRQAREQRFAEEQQQIRTNAWLTAVVDILAASYHSLLGTLLFFQKKEEGISLGGISSASSIFTTLRRKSSDLAQATSNLPNTVVPIQRMEELLQGSGGVEEIRLIEQTKGSQEYDEVGSGNANANANGNEDEDEDEDEDATIIIAEKMIATTTETIARPEASIDASVDVSKTVNRIDIDHTLSRATSTQTTILPNTAEVAISLVNVSLELNDKTLLKAVNLCIGYGEKVAIIGSNGSGKSTLLKLVAGQYLPTGGEMQIFGRRGTEFFHTPARSSWISYIPSEPQLYTKETVGANIRMGITSTDEDGLVQSLLTEMKLVEPSFGEKLISHISGGEAQRVNISRALAHKKPLILADEPTASLDMELADQVMDYLLEHSETMLFITHNSAHALKADRIIYLENGQIVAEISPEEASEHQAYINWAGDHLGGA